MLARMMKRIVACAVLVAAVAGCSSSPPKPFTLRGSMTLSVAINTDINYIGCSGSGQSASVVAGAPVTVYDAAGAIVGTGALGAGKYVTPGMDGPCMFAFEVAGVPASAKFYQVDVAGTGKVTISQADAMAGKFAAAANG